MHGGFVGPICHQWAPWRIIEIAERGKTADFESPFKELRARDELVIAKYADAHGGPLWTLNVGPLPGLEHITLRQTAHKCIPHVMVFWSVKSASRKVGRGQSSQKVKAPVEEIARCA